jgi:predicted RND superfamily exporter protein
VGTPVLFSDLTTIAGFASLAIGPIIPVRVFGLLVAFGTLVILLMSFTLVPALLALTGRGRPVAASEEAEPASRWLARVGQACVARKTAIVLVGAVVVGLFAGNDGIRKLVTADKRLLILARLAAHCDIVPSVRGDQNIQKRG